MLIIAMLIVSCSTELTKITDGYFGEIYAIDKFFEGNSWLCDLAEFPEDISPTIPNMFTGKKAFAKVGTNCNCGKNKAISVITDDHSDPNFSGAFYLIEDHKQVWMQIYRFENFYIKLAGYKDNKLIVNSSYACVDNQCKLVCYYSGPSSKKAPKIPNDKNCRKIFQEELPVLEI